MIKNLIISAILLLGFWYSKLTLLDITVSKDAISIIATVVQISAIMVGFIITAYSVLITVSDKPLIKNMNATGHYSFLLKRLLVAALFFGINLAIGFYLLFTQPLLQNVFIALVSTLVVAIVMFVDAARLFLILISNLNE